MLEPYKTRLLQVLDIWAVTFKMIGTSNYESPRWAQIFTRDGKIVLQSTQRGIWYPIDLTDEEHLTLGDQLYDTDGVWNEWKAIRNNHLKQYHPTIDLN